MSIRPIDLPSLNDNRNYNYTEAEQTHRSEYPIITSLIPKGSSVVDFGCGNGSLLQLLRTEKSCSVHGFDRSESGISACHRKKIPAELREIDQIHPDLGTKAYDFGVCNVTLQMVMYPEILMQELCRVSKKQIVSFPNFANYKNRIDLLIHGRMPRPLLFGYSWYSTGHIHQLSVRDFKDFCAQKNINILGHFVASKPRNALKRKIAEKFPNLFSFTSIFLLEAQS